MKKIIATVIVLILCLSMTIVCYAGDVPEGLLSEDGAKVFLGTVENYTTKDIPSAPYTVIDSVEVIPNEKIKGEVEIGTKQTYYRCHSTLELKSNVEYLFGYFDENNFYIYEIESRTDKQFKLVDSDKHDMTKRFEDYLNEGAFARAEQERSTLGQQISFAEFLYKKPSLSSSGIEKVLFRYQDELYEVDKDEFFEIAENIMITNVKNEPLHDYVAKPKQPDPYTTTLYIDLLGADNKGICFGAVSRFGEVDRYSLSMGRLMRKDYEMEKEDLKKLYALIDVEMENDNNAVIGGADAPTDIIIKDNTNIIVLSVCIGLLIIAFIVGFIIIKKKR